VGGRLWTSLLIGAVAGGTFFAAIQQAASGLIGREPWNWAEMTVVVVIWVAVWPPLMWLLQRAIDRRNLPQSPSGQVRVRQSRLVAPAMKAGRLPSDADPGVWRRALREEVRELSGQRLLAVVASAVGAGVIGASAVLANDNAVGIWAVAVVVATGGSVAFTWCHRRLGMAHRLLAELASP
jgi:hypothetical protein